MKATKRTLAPEQKFLECRKLWASVGYRREKLVLVLHRKGFDGYIAVPPLSNSPARGERAKQRRQPIPSSLVGKARVRRFYRHDSGLAKSL